MQIHEYRKLIVDTEIRANSKLVAFVLCEYFNRKTLECYPSIRTLSRVTGLADKTIQNALSELGKFNLISIQKKKSKTNNFNQNHYSLIGVTTVDTTVDTTVGTTVPVTTKPIEPIKDNKDYKFFGKVIKLKPEHYDSWQLQFQQLNLERELKRLDKYYQEKGVTNWFFPCQGALKKANQNIAPKSNWEEMKDLTEEEKYGYSLDD